MMFPPFFKKNLTTYLSIYLFIWLSFFPSLFYFYFVSYRFDLTLSVAIFPFIRRNEVF